MTNQAAAPPSRVVRAAARAIERAARSRTVLRIHPNEKELA